MSAGTVSGASAGTSVANSGMSGGIAAEATTDVGGDSGAGSDVVSSEEGGTAICSAYCTSIMASCTGEASQYKDLADCMEYCSLMPAGTGKPGDTSDSIGCRTGSLDRAAEAYVSSYLRCLQAGPDTLGYCGDEHITFCNLALSYCTPANGYAGPALYPDLATCESVVSLVDNVTSPEMYAQGNYSGMGVPKADTFACRVYQLVDMAMDGPDVAARQANAAMYCPSVANVSPNCGPGVTVHDQ
jgi:hypothetical protein